MKKVIVVWLLVATFLAWKGYYQAQAPRLVICDVGQGDAILVTDWSKQLLVDAGPDLAVLECLERYLPWWDQRLEAVVATHPDNDHVGGLSAVFQSFRVLTFIHNGDSKQTTDFLSLERLLQRKDTRPKRSLLTQAGDKFQLTPIINFSTLSPRVGVKSKEPENGRKSETKLSDVEGNFAAKTDQYNDRSIALFLTINHLKVLLMADVEEPGEIALLESGLIQEVNVLKVAHHGSKSSTSPRFLAQAKPEISALSLGENNQFGHPSPQVLANLAQIGSKTLRTDQHGDIIFNIIGQKWGWYCSKGC